MELFSELMEKRSEKIDFLYYSVSIKIKNLNRVLSK